MEYVIQVLEFCLICFFGVSWYLAKRDLEGAAARRQEPLVAEMREVQHTVEVLIVALEQKAADIDDRLQRRFGELYAAADSYAHAPPAPDSDALMSVQPIAPAAEAEFTRAPLEPAQAESVAAPNVPITPLDRALDLVDRGAEPATAARETGLTVSEIETAARMRQLRAASQQQRSASTMQASHANINDEEESNS